MSYVKELEAPPTHAESVERLSILNRIAANLNRAVDVRSVLDQALADIVELMGLETAWISLQDPPILGDGGQARWVLAAHHNLPPALHPDNRSAWQGSCACRDMLASGELDGAYNEVRCSRLARGGTGRRGLAVHASAPLRSGDQVLGILNVAAPDWTSFSPEALNLLTIAGSQMATALERARLYDLLQERHTHQAAALLHFSNQLLGRLDLDDLIDYLVEEVRRILRADACALLLPDGGSGNLAFKASSGWWRDPVAEGHRVPADERSGPGTVMLSQKPLLAEDLQAHDPAAWLPDWLREERFRGHAIVPLLVDGRSVGALVIDQRQPRCLEGDDLHTLCLMANQAAIAIEKARLHHQEVKSHAMEKELEVGRQIQLSLLPTAPPSVPGWEFACFYRGAREVSGDFYDFFPLPQEKGKLGTIIADVTGKGVPAALFMARSSAIIRSTCLQGSSPAAALMQANDLILQDRPLELFLTALYAVLEVESGRLTYANGGHVRPLWLRAATGEIRELDAQGVALAAFAGAKIQERQVRLAPGDMLVLYTDGVTEARQAGGQMFGLERLQAVLAANAGRRAGEIQEAIVAAVQAFEDGSPKTDDLTLVIIRRQPSGATRS
ncbi:MAG: SpoIIE family protein phosphatase [Anaerolineae bacterium]|jgi:sigma-B regulation protein RsbU (phosphoserine phosphatase)